jgi:hypothetical protein
MALCTGSGFLDRCAVLLGGWKQSFGDRAAAIFRVDFRDHGDVSIAFLRIQRGF